MARYRYSPRFSYPCIRNRARLLSLLRSMDDRRRAEHVLYRTAPSRLCGVTKRDPAWRAPCYPLGSVSVHSGILSNCSHPLFRSASDARTPTQVGLDSYDLKRGA